jgi:hypothetical protein
VSNPTQKEIIESLRSEITALRQEWTEERINTAALQAHAERVGQANDLLVLENTALQADKERLDWLDSYISTDDTNAVFPRIKRAECHSIREAIDAARKEAQP